MSVADIKIHRRLLPLYGALQRAGYRVEPYLALNTSREAHTKQFGANACDVHMPLGTRVYVQEDNKPGRENGKYRVYVENRRCVLLPKWDDEVCWAEYYSQVDAETDIELRFVFKDSLAIPTCIALLGDLADAELALLKPVVRRVSVLLGLMRRRDLSKPNGARLSKDVRGLIGRVLMAAEMERAKEEVAGWR